MSHARVSMEIIEGKEIFRAKCEGLSYAASDTSLVYSAFLRRFPLDDIDFDASVPLMYRWQLIGGRA